MSAERTKILVVDDQSNSLEVVMNCFNESSYQILYAPNGDIGYEVSVKENPNLIIMDWAMPGMNGLDSTTKLKANEQTRNIPVIIITGVMTETGNLIKALNNDAFDYIRKPIDEGELCARVQSALRKTQHIHELSLRYEAADRFLAMEKRMLIEELDLQERKLSKLAILRKDQYNLLRTILQDLSIIADHYHLKKSKAYKYLEDKIYKALANEDKDQEFLMHFEKVHPSFFNKLKTYRINFTPNELKLCAYIKLGMKNKEIANLLSVELGTVKSNINRLKKKVKLSPEESLRKLVQSLI